MSYATVLAQGDGLTDNWLCFVAVLVVALPLMLAAGGDDPMTTPLTETVTTGINTADGSVHVVCCDPDMGLCGEVLKGEWVPDETPTECGLCALAEDMPCGDPDCPDRESAEEWA